MSTIKVPRELRDRLADLAGRNRTTLAGAIAAALDQAEERELWARARAANAAVPDQTRAEYRSADAGVGFDHLADPDDDAVGAAGGW